MKMKKKKSTSNKIWQRLELNVLSRIEGPISNREAGKDEPVTAKDSAYDFVLLINQNFLIP